MKKLSMRTYGFILLLTLLLTACATTKTLEVWQAEGEPEKLQNILIVAVTERPHLREQFENIIADRFSDRGLRAIASNKLFPELGPDLDREAARKKAEELGVEKVLVARSISRKEITYYQSTGPYFASNAVRHHGWFGFYSGSFSQRAYDTDYYTMVTNIYDLPEEDVIWSYLSQVKVTTSKQGAVEEFIPTLLQKLTESQLIP